MAIIRTRLRGLGDFPSAEQLDAIAQAAQQPDPPTRKVVVSEEDAGVITAPRPKSTASKKIAKQGSAIIDKSAGAPSVEENVLFMGFSVPKRLVPTVLYTPGAQIVLFAALVAGGYLAYHHFAGRRATRTIRRRLGLARNPRRGSRLESHPDPEIAKAAKFRREFHWGNPAKKVSRRKVSPTPRVLAELGEVASITYRTRKRGEKAQFFEHEFEGRRPRLGMDIRNKRLHLLGGSYTVTADGITG